MGLRDHDLALLMNLADAWERAQDLYDTPRANEV